MCVAHRRFDIRVPKNLPDLVDAEAILDQAGRVRVAQCVNRAVVETSPPERLTDRHA